MTLIFDLRSKVKWSYTTLGEGGSSARLLMFCTVMLPIWPSIRFKLPWLSFALKKLPQWLNECGNVGSCAWIVERRRWRSCLFSSLPVRDGCMSFCAGATTKLFCGPRHGSARLAHAPRRRRRRRPIVGLPSFSCVLQFFIRICILLRALRICATENMATFWAPDNGMRFWFNQRCTAVYIQYVQKVCPRLRDPASDCGGEFTQP